MKWALMYGCLVWGIVIGVAGYHIAAKPADSAAPVDWELVTSCVWERWDPGAALGQQTRMIRFCVEVYPEVTP